MTYANFEMVKRLHNAAIDRLPESRQAIERAIFEAFELSYIEFFGSSTLAPPAGRMFLACGNLFDLLEPNPELITLETIAIGLGNQCRFGGQVRQFYSVAEHSVLAANYAVDCGFCYEAARAVLMHDAAEAFVGDIIRPIRLLIPEFDSLEERILDAIAERFEIDFRKHEKTIKQIDSAMLNAERRALYADENAGEAADVSFSFWGPRFSAERFVATFESIRQPI